MKRFNGLALGAVLILTACGDGNRDTAVHVHDAMMRAGDSVSDVSSPLTSGYSVTFTWDIETSLPWDAYAEWLTARLPSFHLVQRTPERLTFSRLTDGDAHGLEVVAVAGSPTMHAHITLTLSPD